MEVPQPEAALETGRTGGVREGGCSAWRLPPDETCARVARSHLRETLTALRLPTELIHDAATMVSELATNAYEHTAVYFRMPIAPAPPGIHLTAAKAAERLHLMPAARGIDRVYRTSAETQSVLSVCHGLTVRCHDVHISWEGASGELRRHAYELVDVAEEVLRRHEELRRPSAGPHR